LGDARCESEIVRVVHNLEQQSEGQSVRSNTSDATGTG